MWLQVRMYIKRWILVMVIGVLVLSIGIAQVVLALSFEEDFRQNSPHERWRSLLWLEFIPAVLRILFLIGLGMFMVLWGARRLHISFLGPLLFPHSLSEIADRLYNERELKQGLRVVALGGGTGMPATLRAMKPATSNLTAVVTMADDGGSSGRLRRELGVQPPGDLRNNLVSLANDEGLMARLFNYRFNSGGDLRDHNFGNLFLAALVGTTGGMDKAAEAAGRILAIQGQVLPVTLTDVSLVAKVRHRETGKIRRVEGESNIPTTDSVIERVFLEPPHAYVLPEVTKTLLEAELIVCGPGSLFTSLLPPLLVNGVPEAIKSSRALCVYVCNIATQPGETDDFDVADHVMALENHLGTRLFDVIVANNHYPSENAGNTIYVRPAPPEHPIHKRYQVVYADLTQEETPWRHDPAKLRAVFLGLDFAKSRPLALEVAGKAEIVG